MPAYMVVAELVRKRFKRICNQLPCTPWKHSISSTSG